MMNSYNSLTYAGSFMCSSMSSMTDAASFFCPIGDRVGTMLFKYCGRPVQ